MEVQTTPVTAGAPAEAPIAVATTENATEEFHSPSSAARALAHARYAKREKEQAQPQGAAEATPDVQKPETAPQAEEGAAPAAEQPSGETESEQEPAELPPIEPPRFWKTEAKERWASLPRETQEYLADREQERDREVRRSQNEAAEQRKAMEAERSQVEQARQQYESALPLLLNNLQSAMSGEFSDIKTMADVQNMATEDWPRYVRWDAQQKQVAAVQQEVKAAEERRSTELAQQWAAFATREDNLFTEKVPEMADKDKAAKLQTAAVSVLKDVGFSNEELARSYHGKQGLSLRDHRVQLLVRDAILWRDAQAKAKAATTKPVPPVQRPGVSQGKGAEREAHIQNLNQQLDGASSQLSALRAAAKLVAARRAAR